MPQQPEERRNLFVADDNIGVLMERLQNGMDTGDIERIMAIMTGHPCRWDTSRGGLIIVGATEDERKRWGSLVERLGSGDNKKRGLEAIED